MAFSYCPEPPAHGIPKRSAPPPAPHSASHHLPRTKPKPSDCSRNTTSPPSPPSLAKAQPWAKPRSPAHAPCSSATKAQASAIPFSPPLPTASPSPCPATLKASTPPSPAVCCSTRHRVSEHWCNNDVSSCAERRTRSLPAHSHVPS